MAGGPPPSATPADTLARSRAFREASLRSEQRRAWAVTGVLILILIPVLVHITNRGVDAQVKAVAMVAILALFTVQLGTVALARWAERRARGMPAWFGVVSVVIESLVPTAMMFWHIVHNLFPPYATLLAPPVVAYGLLISLATLRLRPALCVLGGVVSAAGYAGLLLYVRYGLGATAPTTGLPIAAYANVPVLFFISGLAAAWVAREIRAHMEAALGEVEARRRMDRIEQDLSAARSIQRALLPRAAPGIPGFDIAGWNRPADQTGGDYYDWQALPDGNWIITLADVSGHGIGPAMVTAACRAYMRASSSHHVDLASLVSQVNRLLADDLPEGRFVTMAGVLIDPRRGSLALLSAGHGPIVLYARATGEVRDIMPQDVPLAVAPDIRYQPPQILTLAPGDVLALVTDGFVEWSRPPGEGRREQFGLARLRESLRRHAGLSADAMIEAVAAEVAAFAGDEPQQDDLTMVIIKRVA
jgi:serine phosphatase RsbU (regulator of sigma subunit)